MAEYSEEQLEEIVTRGVAKALEARSAHPDVCPLTADDVVFFRRLKQALDKAASWIGHSLILFLLAAIFFVIKLGVEAYTHGAGK